MATTPTGPAPRERALSKGLGLRWAWHSALRGALSVALRGALLAATCVAGLGGAGAGAAWAQGMPSLPGHAAHGAAVPAASMTSASASTAACEGTGLACASGHAAQLLTFHTLMSPGDEIVSARQLYGGSINQFSQGFAKFDWHTHWADAKNPDSFKSQIDDRTKAVFIESIANPGGIITDIEKIAKIAHDAGVPLIVDNTLASPYLIRPIEWGADIVVHSATKFLGGHGNSMAGVIVDSGKFDWGSGKFHHVFLLVFY